jgi:hypothetical protein
MLDLLQKMGGIDLDAVMPQVSAQFGDYLAGQREEAAAQVPAGGDVRLVLLVAPVKSRRSGIAPLKPCFKWEATWPNPDATGERLAHVLVDAKGAKRQAPLSEADPKIRLVLESVGVPDQLKAMLAGLGDQLPDQVPAGGDVRMVVFVRERPGKAPVMAIQYATSWPSADVKQQRHYRCLYGPTGEPMIFTLSELLAMVKQAQAAAEAGDESGDE